MSQTPSTSGSVDSGVACEQSSVRHTPGPWSVGGKYAFKSVLLNAKGESIASGGNNRSVQGAELEASLRLAAAAPDMLEALREIAEHDWCANDSGGRTYGKFGQIALAAIAAATGEAS